MTAFYICIIIIGIILVVISMIGMVLEKKKFHDYRLDMDERRNDLERVIEDAESLLDELNRFSDYVVGRMEEKQRDIEEAVMQIDKRLELFQQQDMQLHIVTESHLDSELSEIATTEQDEEPEAEVLPSDKKIIPLDVKKREIMKLYQKGMDSTEIAKMLNMGKGEIELISKMSH